MHACDMHALHVHVMCMSWTSITFNSVRFCIWVNWESGSELTVLLMGAGGCGFGWQSHTHRNSHQYRDDWELLTKELSTTTRNARNKYLGQISQTTGTFLHGHFNNYLPIPVFKQYVNSTQQNGFSSDSACMYDKQMHEAAWDCGGFRLKTWILLSDSCY